MKRLRSPAFFGGGLGGGDGDRWGGWLTEEARARAGACGGSPPHACARPRAAIHGIPENASWTSERAHSRVEARCESRRVRAGAPACRGRRQRNPTALPRPPGRAPRGCHPPHAHHTLMAAGFPPAGRRQRHLWFLFVASCRLLLLCVCSCLDSFLLAACRHVLWRAMTPGWTEREQREKEAPRRGCGRPPRDGPPWPRTVFATFSHGALLFGLGLSL